jgi:hypothetical protein
VLEAVVLDVCGGLGVCRGLESMNEDGGGLETVMRGEDGGGVEE